MAYSVSGRIKRKSVKDARVSLNVNGEWYSAFVIGKGVDPEFQEAMRGLMEGDSVDLQVEDNVGKDGKTYHNIKGAVKVVQMRDEEPPDAEIPSQYQYGYKGVPPVQSTGQPHKPESRGDFPYSMMVSYCKDIMIAFPNDGELDLLGRVELVKKMARLMGE